jgi:hypothetical protein
MITTDTTEDIIRRLINRNRTPAGDATARSPQIVQANNQATPVQLRHQKHLIVCKYPEVSRPRGLLTEVTVPGRDRELLGVRAGIR